MIYLTMTKTMLLCVSSSSVLEDCSSTSTAPPCEADSWPNRCKPMLEAEPKQRLHDQVIRFRDDVRPRPR
jgi:hypothetical protein